MFPFARDMVNPECEGVIEKLYPSFGYLHAAIPGLGHRELRFETGSRRNAKKGCHWERNLTRHFRVYDKVRFLLKSCGNGVQDDSMTVSMSPPQMKIQWHGFARVDRIEANGAGFAKTTDGDGVTEIYFNKSTVYPAVLTKLEDALSVGDFIRFIADPIVAYPGWRAVSTEPHDPAVGFSKAGSQLHAKMPWLLCCQADMNHVAGCLFLEGRFFSPYPRPAVVKTLADLFLHQNDAIPDTTSPKRFQPVQDVKVKLSSDRKRRRNDSGNESSGSGTASPNDEGGRSPIVSGSDSSPLSSSAPPTQRSKPAPEMSGQVLNNLKITIDNLPPTTGSDAKTKNEDRWREMILKSMNAGSERRMNGAAAINCEPVAVKVELANDGEEILDYEEYMECQDQDSNSADLNLK